MSVKRVGLALFVVLTLVSCYQFGRIVAARQVKAHESFDGRIVAIDDGCNGPATGYGIFAVRVPENWNVTVGDSAYVQYAKENVTVPGDDSHEAEIANVADSMRYSSLLSGFYNTTNPKDGYTWVAFVTLKPHRRGLQGSTNNSCDSIAVNYVVTNDGVAGDYELDYILGDAEEVVENFVGRLDDAGGTRIFHVSTEQAAMKRNGGEDFFDKVQPEFKTIVTVLAGEEGDQPTVHTPRLTVSGTTFAQHEPVTVNYADVTPDTRLMTFKYANLVAQKDAFTVEGLQRFNSGEFTINDLEPGTYHVRAVEQDGTVINGVTEATFDVTYPDFTPAENSLMVAGDVRLMAPALLTGEQSTSLEEYRAGDARLYQESPQILQTLLDKALEVKPSMLLLSGDLTKDGERLSHELLVEKLQPLRQAGIKVYVVPGDHDVNNPNALTYNGDETAYADNVSAADFASIYADFGYGDAVSRDASSLSYIAYPNEQLAILALDACRYNENKRAGDTPSAADTLVTAGRLTTETLAWMDTVVKEAQATGRKVIVLMHHLVSEPYNGYATLGSVVNGQPIDLAAAFTGTTETASQEPYAVTTADVQNAFASLGLSLVFTGDVAATDIQHVLTGNNGELYQVATAALTAYDCPYRLVNVTDETADIQTRVIKQVSDISLPDGTAFEDYAYYRTKYLTPVLVDSLCARYWSVIDGIFKQNFVFDYNPDTDPINKNDFMKLPADAADMASRVNTNILPPMLDVITSFVEGNEHMKDSQALVDGVKAGFDGFFDSLNTWPSIITPMIKEGFANAGLNTDSIADSVVASLAYNYLGDSTNVTNDLFATLPFTGKSTTAIGSVRDNSVSGFDVRVSGHELTVSFRDNRSPRLLVYTAAGTLLRGVSVVLGNGSQRLVVPQSGVYFVKLGNQVKKVAVGF